MKIELASVAATKLMLTGINSASYKVNKIKSSKGLFSRAMINYYNRIDKLYNEIISNSCKDFKIWYNWHDGISIMIINKNFGVLYTGSVTYGFKISEEDPESNTLHEMELTKYYIKGKSYVKRNPNTLFELAIANHGVKLKGVWTGFRSAYKEMPQKELWYHNLQVIQRVRGQFGFSEEFVDGYSKAINEYIQSL